MRINSQETTNNAQRPENAVRSNDVSRTKSSEGVDNTSETSASDRVELSSQSPRYPAGAESGAGCARGPGGKG